MIYTITFNPALEYDVSVKQFKTGAVNRAHKTQVHPGGKGLNVSTVLYNLGAETTALGFLAGFTGNAIAALLDEKGVPSDFIRLEEGQSRINLKLHTGQETEINGSGPVVDMQALKKLLTKLERLQKGDTLVLAGSVPDGMPDTLYSGILSQMQDRGIRTAVDATGDLLKNTLAQQPWLIKPNHIELGDLFGIRISTPREAELYARKLQNLGARNILVSMGERGAVLLDADGNVHVRRALSGKAVRTTGAGDSMLAGYLAGMDRFGDYDQALSYAVAAASASVFSGTLATQADTQELYDAICRSLEKQARRME